jgi:hypothetical protein
MIRPELICKKEAGVMLKVNEAGWDRIVRIVLGAILLYLGWAGVVTGGWGLAFKVLGFVPLLTGAVGWCPLYALFKFGTRTA